MKTTLATFSLLLTAAFVSLPPALAQTARNEAKYEMTKSINTDEVKTLEANIGMGAGTLTIKTGTEQLFNSRYSYSREAWKPQIDYTKESGRGKLTVKQPELKNTNMNDNERNDWDLTFSRNIPVNLKLRLGAGEGNINLSGARLENLELEAGAGEFNVNLANTSIPKLRVNAGVGELTLNLTGNRTTSLEADVNGGIGDLTLKLPRKTGVRVKVGGLGSIDADGFHKEGGYYVNDAYGKTANNLDIKVSGGLGSINLQLE